MSLSRNKIINIDRYFASLETAEAEPEQPVLPFEDFDCQTGRIQPYQPDHYAEYLISPHPEDPAPAPAPETSEEYTAHLSDEVFSQKLSSLLLSETVHLADHPPTDLIPSTDSETPTPEPRKSLLGVGSIAQVAALTVLINLGLHHAPTPSFNCSTSQLCQATQGFFQKTQSYMQSAGVGVYSAVMHRADPGQRSYENGLQQAYAAAVLVQTASTPTEWMQAAASWQEAINTMESIPNHSSAYDDAQAKLSIYQQHQDYALSEIDPFREGVNAAMAAAVDIQAASSPQDYKQVSQQWMQAISLMQAVTSDSPYYAAAQNKIAEYAGNLAYSQHLSASTLR